MKMNKYMKHLQENNYISQSGVFNLKAAYVNRSGLSGS